MQVIQIENRTINFRNLTNKTTIMIKDKSQNMYKVKRFQNLKILKFYCLQKKRIISNLFKIIRFKSKIHKDNKINFLACRDKTKV